jgi:hypothetical protein
LRDDGLYPRNYQCLYCKEHLRDVRQLTQHEAFCEARAGIERRWRYVIEKARAQDAEG